MKIIAVTSCPTGLALYAKGGAARLVSLEVWELRSAWDVAGGVRVR